MLEFKADIYILQGNDVWWICKLSISQYLMQL